MNRRLIRSALLALLLSLFLAPVGADPNTAASTYDDSGNYGDSQGYGRGRSLGYPGVLADLILLRPAGLVLTVGGAGLFLAATPLTAMAAIAEPHDAFERVGKILVVAPAAFTFNRPLGEMNYQRDGIYPNLTRPQDQTNVQAPVPVVSRSQNPPSGGRTLP